MFDLEPLPDIKLYTNNNRSHDTIVQTDTNHTGNTLNQHLPGTPHAVMSGHTTIVVAVVGHARVELHPRRLRGQIWFSMVRHRLGARLRLRH